MNLSSLLTYLFVLNLCCYMYQMCVFCNSVGVCMCGYCNCVGVLVMCNMYQGVESISQCVGEAFLIASKSFTSETANRMSGKVS